MWTHMISTSPLFSQPIGAKLTSITLCHPRLTQRVKDDLPTFSVCVGCHCHSCVVATRWISFRALGLMKRLLALCLCLSVWVCVCASVSHLQNVYASNSCARFSSIVKSKWTAASLSNQKRHNSVSIIIMFVEVIHMKSNSTIQPIVCEWIQVPDEDEDEDEATSENVSSQHSHSQKHSFWLIKSLWCCLFSGSISINLPNASMDNRFPNTQHFVFRRDLKMKK